MVAAELLKPITEAFAQPLFQAKWTIQPRKRGKKAPLLGPIEQQVSVNPVQIALALGLVGITLWLAGIKLDPAGHSVRKFRTIVPPYDPTEEAVAFNSWFDGMLKQGWSPVTGQVKKPVWVVKASYEGTAYTYY